MGLKFDRTDELERLFDSFIVDPKKEPLATKKQKKQEGKKEEPDNTEK